MDKSRAKALVDAATKTHSERKAAYDRAVAQGAPESEQRLRAGSVEGSAYELERAREALKNSR